MQVMTKHGPRLAIGLPVYNGARFLADALDCFLGQTFPDFELIISDNASTDGTADLCRSYASRDPRVRYHRNERNVGAIPNFNRLVGLSDAPLFKWAANDDLYDARYLEACVGILDDDRDVVLAHSRTLFVDEAGRPFDGDPLVGRFVDPRTGVVQVADDPGIADSADSLSRFWQVLSRARWGTHMFGVIRREALARTRLIANFSGGDRAMLAELSLLGRFRCDPAPLFCKRFHADASCHLDEKEILGWLSADGQAYSRRARQLGTYLATPLGKPVGAIAKAGCVAMVAVHSARVALQAAAGKDARRAVQGLAWRAGGPT